MAVLLTKSTVTLSLYRPCLDFVPVQACSAVSIVRRRIREARWPLADRLPDAAGIAHGKWVLETDAGTGMDTKLASRPLLPRAGFMAYFGGRHLQIRSRTATPSTRQ